VQLISNLDGVYTKNSRVLQVAVAIIDNNISNKDGKSSGRSWNPLGTKRANNQNDDENSAERDKEVLLTKVTAYFTLKGYEMEMVSIRSLVFYIQIPRIAQSRECWRRKC
jgi:hypothetical protein